MFNQLEMSNQNFFLLSSIVLSQIDRRNRVKERYDHMSIYPSREREMKLYQLHTY